jgi:hypothetical protein
MAANATTAAASYFVDFMISVSLSNRIHFFVA